MSGAASLNGQFRGFSSDARDQKLRAFARIIRKYAIFGIHCVVDLDGFADTIAGQGKPFSDPYFWPFHIMIMSVCMDLVERSHRETVDIIFDEHSIFGPRAKPWYPVIRALMNAPEEVAVMPAEPRFRTDEEALPLQGADMLAWLLRRSFTDNWETVEEWQETGLLGPSTISEKDFSWLVEEELGNVGMSPHSQYLTAPRLRGIVDLVDTYLRTDFEGVEIPENVQNLCREAREQRK